MLFLPGRDAKALLLNASSTGPASDVAGETWWR